MGSAEVAWLVLPTWVTTTVSLRHKLGAGHPVAPGQTEEVVLTQRHIDQLLTFSGLNPAVVPLCMVGGELAPHRGHPGWEMSHFPTRECDSRVSGGVWPKGKQRFGEQSR